MSGGQKAHGQRNCLRCGTEFTVMSNTRARKFCSRSCKAFYQAAETPEQTRERFWDKVNKTETCWLWTRSVTSDGYGRFTVAAGARLAHRFAYEISVGPIPDSLSIDHLCRVPACVNPAHLEPVTTRENILRGIGPSAANAAKTHCAKGHPFDLENTHREGGDERGARTCRACNRANAKAYRARKAVAA